MPEGKTVDVIVLFQPTANGAGSSILDVLAQAPGQMAFKTAEEVDAYLQEGGTTPPRTGSVADAFGKIAVPRTADQILAQVRAERDEWGDR